MFPVLFAEDPAPKPQQEVPFYLNPLFLIAMIVLFWVVVVLPSSRRQRKEQEQMLANIKRGAKVVTTAGIIGTVVAAKDGENDITIRSEDTRIRILRSAVVQVIGTDDAEASKA